MLIFLETGYLITNPITMATSLPVKCLLACMLLACICSSCVEELIEPASLESSKDLPVNMPKTKHDTVKNTVGNIR